MASRRQEYLEVFLDEIQELLGKWESIVANKKFPASKDLQSDLFRIIHSIKGASGTMGLRNLSSFVHQTEDLLELVRESPESINTSHIEMIEQSRMDLIAWVESVQFKPLENDTIPDLTEENNKLIGQCDDETQREHRSEIGKLSEFGHVDEGPVSLTQAQSLPENQEGPFQPGMQQSSSLAKPENFFQGDTGRTQEPVSFIRVGMEKIDHLFRIVGELSIQNEILFHAWESGNLRSELASSSINLINKGMTELQDQSFSLRMQPVRPIFVSLQRAAFDVSRTLNKKIKIVIEGEGEEFDKSVLEFMKLPLTHIVRNAVDHGIESTEERKALGKPEISILNLSAEPHSGGVIIKITDDGRGLSPEFIRKKAIQKGFLNPDEEISDEKILQLIFLPGFSTTDRISEISGRGVGLDVVQGAIKDCGGSVRVSAEAGKGTCFEIALPSTMAVLDALIVQIAGENYAIAVSEVSEIVNLSEFHLERTSHNSEVFSIRGNVVPVEKLSDFLPGRKNWSGVESKKSLGKMHDARIAVICSGSGQFPIAFEVDLILGHQPIVARPLDEKIKYSPGISGGTILSDGMPGLIVNLNWICERICGQRREADGNAS